MRCDAVQFLNPAQASHDPLHTQDGEEPTATISTGFKVTAVQFDDATTQWVVDVK